MSFFSCWLSLQRRRIRGIEDLSASVVAKGQAEQMVLQDKALKEVQKREAVAAKKAAKDASKGKAAGRLEKQKI